MDSPQSYINGDTKNMITLTSFHTNPMKRGLILRIHITSIKKKDTRSMLFGKSKHIHILITIRNSYNFNHMSHSSIHGKAHNTSKDSAYTADV